MLDVEFSLGRNDRALGRIDRQLDDEERLLVEVDEDLEPHEGIEDHLGDDDDVFIPKKASSHCASRST